MADLRLDFRIPTDLPSSLPVLPLRKGVLLPGAVLGLTVARPSSNAALKAAPDRVLIVAAQREPTERPAPVDLLPWATLARVVDGPRGNPARILVQGLARVRLDSFPATHPFMEAAFTAAPAEGAWDPDLEGMHQTLREAVAASEELMRGQGKALLELPLPPHLLVDAVAGALDAPEDWKRDVLQTADLAQRADKVLKQLHYNREVADARASIRSRMEADARDMNKEVLLRRQLKAIQEELGEGAPEGDDLTQLKERLDALELPADVRAAVDRELRRLARINPQSPERSVALDWLGWVADLPWTHTSAEGEVVDLPALEAALDESHYGLDDVKRQVVEHLAVRALNGSGRADVLLLVGPPGVGKTSIGQAIAEATGRRLVRVALGGIRDEAELRGHRRTYIGARPGRLIEGLRRAGTADPVVLLDEVDKLGRGWQGDPSAALLEILDPEQNHAFTDHYLEVPFDLSRVLFVATANDLSQVPGPLRDRMEVLDIAGYTRGEKVVIARGHLLEKLAKNAGVASEDVEISDEALKEAIAGWTREAGVRQLQRTLGRVYRAAAVKKARGELPAPLVVGVEDLPALLGRRRFFDEAHEGTSRAGIATGLAWTPTGGDVLYVEASTLPGKGQLLLTGQLGDVMKESARAALTYVLSHHAELGIPVDAIEDKDIHIHVPAGAVPKDGPSAGVTLFTALASLLSGRPVRGDVAMTGEATLRGRVLPVGGIKSKVLAAHRQGLRRIILPRRNEGDLEDVPADVRAELDVVFVDHMEQALAAALEPVAEQPEVAGANGPVEVAA